MSDEDGVFLLRPDLKPDEIQRRIAKALAGNPSRRFLDRLAIMFTRSTKKLPFEISVKRTDAHRPKSSRSQERADAARVALVGASRGQVDGILKGVADRYGVKLRTIYADVKASREADELFEWITAKNYPASHEKK